MKDSLLTSPATFQAGDNVTLVCVAPDFQGSLVSYTWPTITLTDLQTAPSTSSSSELSGYFLHGANNGNQQCNAVVSNTPFSGQGSFTINVEGEFNNIGMNVYVCMYNMLVHV